MRPLVLAAGDVLSLEQQQPGGGGGYDKTAFAAELQGEAAATQVEWVCGCLWVGICTCERVEWRFGLCLCIYVRV